MSILNYWRLADQLTVTQAALLVCGLDPSEWETRIDDWKANTFPQGYYPARCAIAGRLRTDREFGEAVLDCDGDPIPRQSIVHVDALKSWLWAKGLRDGFFFPAPEVTRDYLNSNHPRYAPHLAAAVRAWEALDDSALLNGSTPKQASDKWLRENAAAFSLLNEADGTHNNKAIERVSQVTNWAPQGGAPTTPSGKAANLAPPLAEPAILKLPSPARSRNGESGVASASGFDLDEIPF